MDIQVIGSGSTGNAYVVSDGKTSVLLDCGLSIKQLQAATGHTISRMDGCLLSHSHGDHSKAHRDVSKLGVSIYTHRDTIEQIRGVGHRYKAIEGGVQFRIGTFDVLPFELVHDVKNHGFLIYSTVTGEKLLYATDTMYLPYRFNGITHWIIEANNDDEVMAENVERGGLDRGLRNRIRRSHMSIETLLGVFSANDMSKAEKIYLCHLSGDNSREAEFKDKVEKATGAHVIVC
jgi:phosphoribosyl 1,2-cyclic phosphodiesterase